MEVMKEIKSCDTTFLDDEFPCKSVVYFNWQVYEIVSSSLSMVSCSTLMNGQVQLKLNKCSKLLKSIELVRPFEIEHPNIFFDIDEGGLVWEYFFISTR